MRHDRGRSVVDVALPLDAAGEHVEPLGEMALRARERQLVGLREMEHDVGDGPSLAPCRPLPARVVEAVEQRRQLRVLVFEGGEDCEHEHLR